MIYESSCYLFKPCKGILCTEHKLKCLNMVNLCELALAWFMPIIYRRGVANIQLTEFPWFRYSGWDSLSVASETVNYIFKEIQV